MTGCYTLEPVMSPAPTVGSRLALDVTDVGRVALGGTIGPEIAQIEGHLVEPANGEYVLAVREVRFLRGGSQVWTGEQVRIKKEYVGRTYERKFHRGRTIALATVMTSGLLAVAISQDLFGLGSLNEPGPRETIINTDFRPRRRP